MSVRIQTEAVLKDTEARLIAAMAHASGVDLTRLDYMARLEFKEEARLLVGALTLHGLMLFPRVEMAALVRRYVINEREADYAETDQFARKMRLLPRTGETLPSVEAVPADPGVCPYRDCPHALPHAESECGR